MGESFMKRSTVLVRGSGRPSPDCLELVDWTMFKCSAEYPDKYATTVMDFISKCKGRRRIWPIDINRTKIERVKSIKLLGVTITDDLSWTSYVDVAVKKVERCFFFLRQLRKL
eukprot:g26420.t1